MSVACSDERLVAHIRSPKKRHDHCPLRAIVPRKYRLYYTVPSSEYLVPLIIRISGDWHKCVYLLVSLKNNTLQLSTFAELTPKQKRMQLNLSELRSEAENWMSGAEQDHAERERSGERVSEKSCERWNGNLAVHSPLTYSMAAVQAVAADSVNVFKLRLDMF